GYWLMRLRLLEVGERGDGRFAVPGADVLADVAADNGVAHLCAKFFRDRAAQLDSEIGDAAARVENIRRGECLRGAGVEAARAGAAQIGGGRLGWVERGRESGFEIEGGENDSEKKPRAELPIDEAGIFCEPAEACILGHD